jgi:hypothetical protein
MKKGADLGRDERETCLPNAMQAVVETEVEAAFIERDRFKETWPSW